MRDTYGQGEHRRRSIPADRHSTTRSACWRSTAGCVDRLCRGYRPPRSIRLLVRNISVVGVGWGSISTRFPDFGRLVRLGAKPAGLSGARSRLRRSISCRSTGRVAVWTTTLCSAGCVEPKRMLAFGRYGDAGGGSAGRRFAPAAGVTNAAGGAIGYPIALASKLLAISASEKARPRSRHNHSGNGAGDLGVRELRCQGQGSRWAPGRRATSASTSHSGL